MKWWLRFGCSLTGWNANMLAQCSEASKSQLSKYTSALLILMIVWSITGFLFAQRYVGLPVWGCLLVSLVFVTIVVMIERQIILAINLKLADNVFPYILYIFIVRTRMSAR